MSRLLISFSGGETSAFMAQWILNNWRDRYDEMICVFANTGQENEETLRFVQKCDEAFDLGVVWVEAVVNGQGKGCTHRVVNYWTASRQGEPFEAVIEKYGIPNKAYPHCTRELKLNAIASLVRAIGWEKGSYDTAVGIRSDEIDRMAADAKKHGLVYPLVSKVEMTKPRVNAWWKSQPFRLQLKGYEGNCKWCWKKSLRKHLTLITDHPEWYDFPERMEREHGVSGHNVDGNQRVFFREGLSTKDLRELAAKGGFRPAHDDSQDFEDQLSMDLDASSGCSESCEIDFTEVAV